MASVIPKNIVFTAVVFDGTLAVNLYPANFQKNASSPTGYSYGTLDFEPLPEDASCQRRKGFIVPEKCVVLFDCCNKMAEILTAADYAKKYQSVNLG